MSNLRKDTSWFQKVFDEYYEYVRNYIYYLSGDIELAEDLVQDVFLKLWEKQNSVKVETVKSLLFTIARNLYFNSHKRKNIEIKFINSIFDDSDTESPEFIMEMKEFNNKLQSSISNLPERCRTFFLLNRIDDMKYTEIAESFGVSVKAVEKQISKALKLLREQIEQKI